MLRGAMPLHYGICRVYVLSRYIQRLKRRSEPTHNAVVHKYFPGASLMPEMLQMYRYMCMIYAAESSYIVIASPHFLLAPDRDAQLGVDELDPALHLSFFFAQMIDRDVHCVRIVKNLYSLLKSTHRHTVHHSECVFVRTVQIGVPAGSAPGCPRVIKKRKPAIQRLYQTTNTHYDKIKKKKKVLCGPSP